MFRPPPFRSVAVNNKYSYNVAWFYTQFTDITASTAKLYYTVSVSHKMYRPIYPLFISAI